MSDGVSYTDVRAAWDRMKETRGYRAVRGDGYMTRGARRELHRQLSEIELMDRALGSADSTTNWREAIEEVRSAIDNAPVHEESSDAPAEDTHGVLHRAAHDSYASMEADWAQLERSDAHARLGAGTPLEHHEVAALQLALEAFGDRAERLDGRDPARARAWHARLDKLEHGLRGIARAGPGGNRAFDVGRALDDMDSALDRLSIITGTKK